MNNENSTVAGKNLLTFDNLNTQMLETHCMGHIKVHLADLLRYDHSVSQTACDQNVIRPARPHSLDSNSNGI